MKLPILQKTMVLLLMMDIPAVIVFGRQMQQESTSFYVENEELLYEVSWSGITIGTIRLRTESAPENSTQGKRKAVAYIDSRSGLPFVDLHSIAFTEMDSLFNSLCSYSYDKKDDGWQKLSYQYDFSQKKIIVEEVFLESLDSSPVHPLVRDTLSIGKAPIQDGVSLVFLARHLLRNRDTISYPTVSNEKMGETLFYPSRAHPDIEIDAWKNPIRTVEISGKMILEGVFGLSGDFKGWFSNDAAAVPILARMKVILGSVKIELIQWNRKGWSPPE